MHPIHAQILQIRRQRSFWRRFIAYLLLVIFTEEGKSCQRALLVAAALGTSLLAAAPTHSAQLFASSNHTVALQIYFLPVVQNADMQDTALFFYCLEAECLNNHANHIPPYDVTAEKTNPPHTYWAVMSVPGNTWAYWAGCDPHKDYPCTGSGNSREGQWAVITRDGIDAGPNILSDMDKAAWGRWAIKTYGVQVAAMVAARYLAPLTPGQAGAAIVAALAGGAGRRFSQFQTDPYDNGYDEVAVATPWPFQPSGNRCADTAANAIARVVGVAQALYTSINRYTTSIIDANATYDHVDVPPDATNNQMNAVANFTDQLHNTLDPVQSTLPGIFRCSPYLHNVNAVDAISQLQSDQANGPSGDVVQALNNIGITDPDEINAIVYGDPNLGNPDAGTSGPGLATIDPNIAYTAFQALFGPKDGSRDNAWAQLDSMVQ